MVWAAALVCPAQSCEGVPVGLLPGCLTGSLLLLLSSALAFVRLGWGVLWFWPVLVVLGLGLCLPPRMPGGGASACSCCLLGLCLPWSLPEWCAAHWPLGGACGRGQRISMLAVLVSVQVATAPSKWWLRGGASCCWVFGCGEPVCAVLVGRRLSAFSGVPCALLLRSLVWCVVVCAACSCFCGLACRRPGLWSETCFCRFACLLGLWFLP